MPSTIRKLLIALVAIALLALTIWWIKRPEPIPVTLERIGRGKVESTIANTRAGTVEACQRTRLSTIMGGRIKLLAVREGEYVEKGQLLMKLWNDDQEAQIRLAETQIITAQQQANQACTQTEKARKDAERQASLRKRGFVSESIEESALTNAEALISSCKAAEASVEQAKARLNVAQVEVARTALYAPFNGVVANIVGEVGEYSTPSPPGVLTPPAIDLFDDSCLYITAPMDEVDAPKIHQDQPVRITLDAFPDQSFPGKVKRVAPYISAVESQARTVEIEATFDAKKAPKNLLVGYSADVEVILDARSDVIRVPTSSILEGPKVLVANSEGLLEAREIKTGLSNWEYTELLGGLNAGERVVTSLERADVKAGALYTVEDPEKK